MKVFHRLELSLQGQLKGYWQPGRAIMPSFWVTHHNPVLFKVHIFHPQTSAAAISWVISRVSPLIWRSTRSTSVFETSVGRCFGLLA